MAESARAPRKAAPPSAATVRDNGKPAIPPYGPLHLLTGLQSYPEGVAASAGPFSADPATRPLEARATSLPGRRSACRYRPFCLSTSRASPTAPV